MLGAIAAYGLDDLRHRRRVPHVGPSKLHAAPQGMYVPVAEAGQQRAVAEVDELAGSIGEGEGGLVESDHDPVVDGDPARQGGHGVARADPPARDEVDLQRVSAPGQNSMLDITCLTRV